MCKSWKLTKWKWIVKKKRLRSIQRIIKSSNVESKEDSKVENKW